MIISFLGIRFEKINEGIVKNFDKNFFQTI